MDIPLDAGDRIVCPPNVIEPLLRSANILVAPVQAHKYTLSEISERTIMIFEETTATYGSAIHVHRVERYMLIGDKEGMYLYDTILSASSQGKAAGETMLQMLSTSMEGV